MSTPATRKGRRKLGLLASLFAAFGVFLAVGVGSASATVSCAYDGDFAKVVIVISDDHVAGTPGAPSDNTVTIRRSGEAIVVNGATCVDPSIPAAATSIRTRTISCCSVTASG